MSKFEVINGQNRQELSQPAEKKHSKRQLNYVVYNFLLTHQHLVSLTIEANTKQMGA